MNNFNFEVMKNFFLFDLFALSLERSILIIEL